MRYFIAIRANSHTRPGWYWLSPSDEPDMLFRGQLVTGARGTVLTQTGQIPVPFDFLAPVIVEMNFTISQRELSELQKRGSKMEVEEARQFKHSVEDIVEPEVQRRIEAAEPSYKKSSGIIVPTSIKKAEKKSERKRKGEK